MGYAAGWHRLIVHFGWYVIVLCRWRLFWACPVSIMVSWRLRSFHWRSLNRCSHYDASMRIWNLQISEKLTLPSKDKRSSTPLSLSLITVTHDIFTEYFCWSNEKKRVEPTAVRVSPSAAEQETRERENEGGGSGKRKGDSPRLEVLRWVKLLRKKTLNFLTQLDMFAKSI